MDYLAYTGGRKAVTTDEGVVFSVYATRRNPNPQLFGNIVSDVFSRPIRSCIQQCWDSSLSDSVHRAFSHTPPDIPHVPTTTSHAESNTRKGCLKQLGESSAPKKSVRFKAGPATDITNGEPMPQSNLSRKEWHARKKAAIQSRETNEAGLTESDRVL